MVAVLLWLFHTLVHVHICTIITAFPFYVIVCRLLIIYAWMKNKRLLHNSFMDQTTTNKKFSYCGICCRILHNLYDGITYKWVPWKWFLLWVIVYIIFITIEDRHITLLVVSGGYKFKQRYFSTSHILSHNLFIQ